MSNGNLGEAGIVGGLFFPPYGYCNTGATKLE